MDIPLLLILVVLTTGCGWVPNLLIITPSLTGHGSLPLFAWKLVEINLPSGVREKFVELLFLFDSAIANLMSFCISLSINLVCFSFLLISNA